MLFLPDKGRERDNKANNLLKPYEMILCVSLVKSSKKLDQASFYLRQNWTQLLNKACKTLDALSRTAF